METFETRVVSHIPDLTRLALRLTRSPDHAADLVQDTVERALRKKHLFQAGTNMRSWLFLMLRNVFLNDMRHERARIRNLARMEPDTERVEPNQFDRVVFNETLAAIRALPWSDRQVLVEHIFVGRRHDEIAPRLGISVGTVKSRLCRARARLHAAAG